MDDLVAQKLRADLDEATKQHMPAMVVTTDYLRATLDRIQALETSLAEAEGRVIAEVVAWLRHPDRRKLIEVEPAKPGYWTNDDEPEWVFSRSALKRLPNHKDFATALETGGWEK